MYSVKSMMDLLGCVHDTAFIIVPFQTLLDLQVLVYT